MSGVDEQASQGHGQPHEHQGQKEEDKEECSWCRWMKAGGCKSQFEVWLQCVDSVRDAGRDDVETCASVMGPLWDCMARNQDYYAPQLDVIKERQGENDQAPGKHEERDVSKGGGSS
ncbi:GCK domain-containing protein [Dunaliella salina]|uniref:GCK domain-containing protein n=1 Tax=Dunaliella salina TaxID=3046 RepID=A0ABQ7G628_DUNSA|nr:GCK domain-containing protein [Dunaliella salina]|eukprot:KAF5830034.1 GCK domain-containing protein [Dunaliella salina]